MRGGGTGAPSGVVEWRGVDIATGKEVFRSDTYPEGTIAMGEFAALLDGIKHAMDNGYTEVYTDSVSAMTWLKNGVDPKMKATPASLPLCERIWSDVGWLQLEEVRVPAQRLMRKWLSKEWGENPADLGYKGYQKKSYFAVKVGRQRGIFLTWVECAKQVSGYPRAKFKGFITIQEAEAYLNS